MNDSKLRDEIPDACHCGSLPWCLLCFALCIHATTETIFLALPLIQRIYFKCKLCASYTHKALGSLFIWASSGGLLMLLKCAI